MRGVLGDLGQEGIGEEDGGLVAVAGGRIAEKSGDVHLEGAGETIERGQGGHGLAVLDLGDVGAGHSHARGELALGEVADVAKVAHGGGNLGASARGASGSSSQRDGLNFGGLGQQRLLAATAGVVSGAELHQLAGSQRRTSRSGPRRPVAGAWGRRLVAMTVAISCVMRTAARAGTDACVR